MGSSLEPRVTRPIDRDAPRRRRRGRDRRDLPIRRVRRIILIAATLVLIPTVISFVTSIRQQAGTPVSIAAVEWLRSHGARGIVDGVESVYYSIEAPSKGGSALKRLPRQSGQVVSAMTAGGHLVVGTAKKAVHYEPPNITPLIHPALPGEGVWHEPFHAFRGPPPVLVTSYRSEPDYPQVVAGVAWIDHTETSPVLYPGILEPDVTIPDRGPEEVPPALRSRLVATFNSAFKLSDPGGGFGENGHTYAPMHDGQATVVRLTTGRTDVISWTGGATIGPDVRYARQNLQLIVDGGKPNPNLSDGPQWGATLGNAVQVWRSALGIDAHGNLIYAAADYQTVGSLAAIMIRAGAVRAMELDINAFWPSFITYTGTNATGAANLLPGMAHSPDRYLTPDDRDFFAVYLNN
jgi:hypothetical protein